MRTEQTDDACGDNRRNRGKAKQKKEIRKTTKKVFDATKEKKYVHKGNTKTSHFYFEYSHAQLSAHLIL